MKTDMDVLHNSVFAPTRFPSTSPPYPPTPRLSTPANLQPKTLPLTGRGHELLHRIPEEENRPGNCGGGQLDGMGMARIPEPRLCSDGMDMQIPLFPPAVVYLYYSSYAMFRCVGTLIAN
ncbi:hypothetical protein GWI33_021573 [Rhynchophorus ferrugineus]|uniref:Uncharacterized protein n=1 Tax=Rhynchophorus ferrugineus TaxID=354439 RepID=A0A834MIH8_RHYFE|nr:hypothetical protein GWI33_021573 [Rhynchophorus ferrugineus]